MLLILASLPWVISMQVHAGVDGKEPQAVCRELEDKWIPAFPGVRIAEQEVQRAQGEYESALGSFYDPMLRTQFGGQPLGDYNNLALDTWVEQMTPLWGAKLIGGYRYSLGKFPLYDGKLETAMGGEFRLGLELPLLRNGWTDLRRVRIQVARTGIDESHYLQEQAIWEIRRAFRHRFWSWIAAHQSVEIQRGLLKLATTRARQLELSAKSGETARIDLVDNERAIVQRQGFLVQAELQENKTRLDLALYVAELPPLETVFHLEPPTNQAASAEVQADVALHPETLRMWAALARAEEESLGARNQQLPRLDMFAQAAQDVGAASSSSQTAPELRAGLQLEFPILNRNADGRAIQAESGRIRAEQSLELTRRRLTLTFSEQNLARAAALSRLELSQQEVRLAEKLEAAEVTKLKAGTSNLFLVNLREQSTADARLRFVTAYEQYYKALADIETSQIQSRYASKY